MPNAVGITEDLSRQWEDGRFGPEFCSSDMDANVFESRHLFGVTLLVDCVRFELCPSDIRDSGPSSEPGPNSVHDVVDNRVPSHFLACVILFVSDMPNRCLNDLCSYYSTYTYKLVCFN